MLRLCLRRFGEAIPVLWCLLTLTFIIARCVPGGPFDREMNASPEIVEQLKHFYGYDDTLFHQYLNYMKHLLCGDLGPSMRYAGYSVNQLLAARIPVSFELGFWAILVAFIVGGTCGMLAALKADTWIDRLLMSLCLSFMSLPTFVIGPLIILFFSLKLQWFYAIGWNDAADRILPTLTLACMYSGYIARLTRTCCIEVLSQAYIRTAFAKGLCKAHVFIVHVLKNALGPVLSYLGPTAAAIMSGSLVIESLFQIPGAGSLFITAVGQRDISLLLGTVLYFALLIIVFNLLVDLGLLLLDPRQRSNA